MVAGIMSFMSYPAIIFCVNVRGFRMAFLITIGALGRWRPVCGLLMRCCMRRRRAMCRNMTAANAAFGAVLWRLSVLRWSGVLWWGSMLFMTLLRNRGKTSDQHHHPHESKKSNEFFGAYIRNE